MGENLIHPLMSQFNRNKHLYSQSRSKSRGFRPSHKNRSYVDVLRDGFSPSRKRRLIESASKKKQGSKESTISSSTSTAPHNTVAIGGSESSVVETVSNYSVPTAVESTSASVASNISAVQSQPEDQEHGDSLLDVESTPYMETSESQAEHLDLVDPSAVLADINKLRTVDKNSYFSHEVHGNLRVKSYIALGKKKAKPSQPISCIIPNEDAVATFKTKDGKLVALVLDGISESNRSSVFARNFIDRFAFFAKQSSINSKSDLLSLINKTLRYFAKGSTSEVGGATLALAVELDHNNFLCASIGDAIVGLVDPDGSYTKLTYDQVLRGSAITSCLRPGEDVFENTMNLFHGIFTANLVEVQLSQNELLILGSDGNDYLESHAPAYTQPTFPNPYTPSEISDVSIFMGDRIDQHNAKQAHEAKVARKLSADCIAALDDVYDTIKDNISGVAIKVEESSANPSQWNASDVNFIKNEQQLNELESIRLNAGLQLYVSIDSQGLPKMNVACDFDLGKYYQLPSVINDLFDEFSKSIANLPIAEKAVLTHRFNNEILALPIQIEPKAGKFLDKQGWLALRSALGDNVAFLDSVQGQFWPLLINHGRDPKTLLEKMGSIVNFRNFTPKQMRLFCLLGSICGGRYLEMSLDSVQIHSSADFNNPEKLLALLKKARTENETHQFKALIQRYRKQIQCEQVLAQCDLNSLLTGQMDADRSSLSSSGIDLDLLLENVAKPDLIKYCVQDCVGDQYRALIKLENLEYVIDLYPDSVSLENLYKLLNRDDFNFSYLANDSQLLSRLASISELDLSKITNQTLKVKLQELVLFPAFSTVVTARKSDSYAPSKFGLVPRVNWRTKQIEMVYPDSGTVVTMFKDGDFVKQFNTFLGGFDEKFKAQGYRELVNQFVSKNADQFEIKKPTGFWHNVDRFANSFIYSFVPSAMHRMSQLQKAVLPATVAVSLGYALFNYLGADDGGAVAATMHAPSLTTDNLSGGAEAGDSITGTSLNSGGAVAGDSLPGNLISDSSLNSAGASTSDSGVNSGGSDQVISSSVDNAGRSSLEQNKLKDSVETPVPVQKVVAETRENIQVLNRDPKGSLDVNRESDFSFAANDVQNPSYVDLEGVEQLHADRMLTMDSITNQPQALVEMRQNWDFTQAGSLSDVYAIDEQGLEALNQDMAALPDSNFAGQEVEVDTLGDRLLARDANGEVVKAKQGLLRRMKSVGTADGSSLTLDGESKIFKVYDKGVMKAIRYFKASDGHYYAGCYLKAV